MKRFALALFALSACAADIRLIFPPGSKPVGPYSPGLMAGDYLYVSGQGARDPSGSMPATVEAQARQTLENVKQIVEAAGLTFEHVVYAQLYLADIGNYATVNRIWSEYFPRNPPARATLAVTRMPTETPIEITVVAHKDRARLIAVRPPGVTTPVPITPAILTPDRLYLSGILGRDTASGVIPDEPAAQVEMAFDRARRVLTTAGLDFRHVVFTNVYITAKMPRRVMDSIYQKYFEFGQTPARATIQVAALPFGANIELTGVAVRDLAQRRVYKPKNMAPSATASPCVEAGDTLYCSAKSAFIPGPESGIWSADVETQVRQTMRNLLDGLDEAGLTMRNVVATNVYLDTIDDFARMNGIYAKFFAAPHPTRTTVQPLAPVERKPNAEGRHPMLEQISLIAVR